MEQTAIERAIDSAGGQEALGAMLDPPVTQQAISKMKAQGFTSPEVATQLVNLFGLEYAHLINPRWRGQPAQQHRPGAGVQTYKD